MKSIRLIIAAFIMASLTSGSLIGSLLKIPSSLLKSVGRTAGMGLTDEAPSPIEESPVVESPIIEAPQTQTEPPKTQP